VKEYIVRTKPELARLPIVIRAFANIDGMSTYLSKVGLAQSSANMWSFAKAFSQAHAGSDFVFVGSGKDRADKKIKGTSALNASGDRLTDLILKVFSSNL
jgi:hypothetical protein